jgi:hypothetical protein
MTYLRRVEMSSKLMFGLALSSLVGLGVAAMPGQTANATEYHPPKHYKPYEVTEGWIYKKYCSATIENAKTIKVSGPANLRFILKEKRDRDHDYKDDNYKDDNYKDDNYKDDNYKDDNKKYYKGNYDYKKNKPKHPKSFKLTIICKFKPNYPVFVDKVKDSEDFKCHQFVANKFDRDTYDSFASVDVEKVRIKWRYFNVIKKVLLKCTFDEKHKRDYPSY